MRASASLGAAATLLILLAATPAECVSALPGWPQTTGDQVISSPAVADLDGDGDPEIVVGSWDGKVYAWHVNGTAVSGWPQATGDGITSSPVVGDIDRDGQPEVVVGSWDGKVYAWHADGTALPGWPQDAGGAVTSSPALADLGYDGKLEVIVGGGDDKVHVWRADGSVPYGWPQEAYGPIASSPAAAPLDAFGLPAVVVGSGDGRVYAWRSYGLPLSGWPQEVGNAVYNAPALGDLDGDGDMEVVANSNDGAVRAFHADGTTISGWPTYNGGGTDTSAVLGDLDGDGTLEVIAGSESGSVFAWHADGTIVAGWPQSTGSYTGRSPALADLDGDGAPEVIVGSWDKSVYAWNGDGTAVTGWPQATGGLVVGSPAISDLDGDGKLEVVVGATDGKVYAWKADAATDDRNPWPTFRHDLARTGCYIATEVPVADFHSTGGMPWGTVYFTDESSGRPTAWLWDFGDGGVSTQQNPIHVYAMSGLYTVSLTATNVLGSDTLVLADYVLIPLETQPGWPQPGGSDSAPAVGDLDGDGKLEVVSTADQVYVRHFDGTLVTGWPKAVTGLLGDPALADLDDDGALEVIVSGGDGVHVWDGSGVAVSGWPAAVISAISTSPALADIDGDGVLEVVAGAVDGKVYAWHADGTPIADWPKTAGGAISCSPAIDDLDADGDREVVVGAADGKVYAWHAGGAPVSGWPVTIGGEVRGSPALGELDGDGDLEVVAGSTEDGNVYAWHANGTLVAGWPQPTEPSFYTMEPSVYTAPALGDLDGDGDLEVIVSGADTAAYAWHADGTAVAGWPQGASGHGAGSPSLGDVDGDGTLEVILGIAHSGMAGYVWAWNADGSVLPDFPLFVPYYTMSSAALADLEGDGRDEMVIGCEDGNVYAWKLGPQTDDRLPWTMFKHDAARTGRYVPTTVPVASFSAAPTTGTVPLTVRFTDESTGHPTAWAWSFGDGTASTQQNPKHTYTAAGSYTVALTASNAAGSDTETKTNFIVLLPLPPAAAFSGTPTTGAAPLLVHFTDDSTGSPTAWLWEFGDDTTATEPNLDHTYAAPGSYTVSLTVTNAGGSDEITKEDYILVTAVPAPLAAFSGQPTSGAAPLSVAFTDLSTNSPTAWLWAFGDGGASTDQSPTHVYAAPGFYTVSLTVTNAGGSDTEEKPDYITAVFPDVLEDSWAFGEIMACVDADIVQGYSDGRYHPQDPVTRAQMAAYIARALAGGDDAVPEDSNGPAFTDVNEDYWAYDYIEYCAAHGVVQGYSDGTYQPELVVTRDQMAVYIARAIADPVGEEGLAGYVPPAEPTFSDVGTDQWAYRYIEYCHEHGVVQGYSDGTYHPEREVSRDQMAVYIARAFELPVGTP
jgi:PKD repeat protein